MPTPPTTSAPDPEAAGSFKLTDDARRVFVGLMIGMLVASVSQTIVGPAMPRIVAELGGMDHYSWVATAAMLVSAISVPIVGKLSDLYGRRPFYLAGLGIFLAGSLVSGTAQNFWWLVAGRAIQGSAWARSCRCRRRSSVTSFRLVSGASTRATWVPSSA